jgi:hypothetical protein
MDPQLEYRQILSAKLAALGAAPKADVAPDAASGAMR